MPRRKITPNSIQAQVEDEVDRELDDLVAEIAAEEGLARGAQHVSPEKEVELWGQRDPRVDFDSLKQQLMTGSVSPELYDPQSDARLALVRALPAYADLFAQVTPESPLDDEMASIVADLAEFPFRAAVLQPYEDDPRAQVRKATSVNERWLRRQGVTEEAPESAFDTHAAPSVSSAPMPEAVAPVTQEGGY